MLATTLDQIDTQLRMTPELAKAVAFLRRTDLASLPDGRTDIDGDRVFALVQRYETLPPGQPLFEYHRKYIDIQVVVAGVEVIGWAPANAMQVTEPYNADKDIAFGRVPDGAWTPVRLGAGQLAVLWPADAHAPKQSVRSQAQVMKIVVKVAA